MNDEVLLDVNQMDDVLENIRHDLCTPLTGIIGFAKRIQQQTKEPHIQQYADTLVAATNALLHFQKNFFQDESVSEAVFDFRLLVDEVIALSKPGAVLKQLALSYQCDSVVPKKMIADRQALFRILLELTTNAIKFTQRGGIEWFFSVSQQDEKNCILHCDIRDTGVGIPKKNHKKIFDRFYQEVFDERGAGLGLSIVKTLLEKHQGSYRLQSKVGVGTTISCDIPVKISVLKKTKKYNVLLIEDHKISATAGQFILEDCNCEVDVAQHLEQVLFFIKTKMYDFIFLDLHLPDKNSAILIAKQIQKVLKNIVPLIGITASSFKEKVVELDMILEKPLSIKKIEGVIHGDRFRAVDLTLGAKRLGRKKIDAKEFLKAIFDSFSDEKKEWLKAIKERDSETLKNKNHRLLGALRYCGAPALECISSELQKMFDAGDHEMAFFQAKKVIAWMDKTKNSVR